MTKEKAIKIQLAEHKKAMEEISPANTWLQNHLAHLRATKILSNVQAIKAARPGETIEILRVEK